MATQNSEQKPKSRKVLRGILGGSMLIMFVIVCSVAVFGGGDGENAPRPGQPEVYQRIESLTDCRALQESFDRAMDNSERYPPGHSNRTITLSYAKAADERMRAIGCY